MKPLLAAAILGALGPSPQAWWNAEWKYRRPVQLKNQIEDAELKAGYPIQIEFSSAYLGIHDKAAPDLRDLALVFGGKEVPIALAPGRTPGSTVLWFRTQAAIPARAADGGYALYYGNAKGTGARAPLGDILDLHEDFSQPDAFRSLFDVDKELSCAVEDGALVLKDVADGRSEHSPARLVFKKLPSAPGFAVTFDLEIDPQATPVGFSLTVDLKDPAAQAGDLARQIAALVDQLGDFDWQVREKATKELARIGKPAVAKLLSAAKDADAEVRWRAEHILKEIRERGSSPTITAGVRTGEGAGEHRLALHSRILSGTSRTMVPRAAFAKIQIAVLRDPDGEVMVLWNSGNPQKGKLKGEVDQIYFSLFKGAAGPLPPLKIDNVVVRRYAGEDGRPTHTVDVEETRK